MCEHTGVEAHTALSPMGKRPSVMRHRSIARRKRKVGCVKGDSLFVLHTFVLFEFLQACIQVFV